MNRAMTVPGGSPLSHYARRGACPAARIRGPMAPRKHYEEEGVVYHVTTRTLAQEFHLASASEKKRIICELGRWRTKGHWKLCGFVVMDNHLHAVVQPVNGNRLGDIMRKFKTWTSRRNILKQTGQALWEEGYDDNVIQSCEELRNVLEYMHNNPVRAGMVTRADQYPWSSVHNYLANGREIIEIDVDWW